MRAMLCTAFEGPDALELGEAPDPVAGPDEVVIDVAAASVSYMDLLMTQGLYQLKPELPYVPGTDAAGVVSAVGEAVTRFKPGDRVAGSTWYGAYAEKMRLKEPECVAIPDGVDLVPASTLLHNHRTALYSLRDRADLSAGETLLVTGAAGGVGLATVEIGRILGAEVIAGVGDDAKEEAVRAAGAAHVVNYRTENLRARLKEITGGRGVDVCAEMVGGDLFGLIAREMAWGGRLMPVGFAGGEIPSLPMNLPLVKGFSVVGVFMGAWNSRFPEEGAAVAAELMTMLERGEIQPAVDRVLPLSEAAEAMQLVAERKVRGRVVLDVAGATEQ